MRLHILPIAALTASASAWGFIGHKTVALLASRYLLPETAVFVQNYLYKDQTIMDAAVWADRFAHIPLGRFSKTWHYIDAQDNPPELCEINYNRDCAVSGGGCIVSALVNMTARIQDESLNWPQRAQALRFILHFLGDIHQPLHTEHKDRGGNSIKVLFHGHEANLHQIWDSKIIEGARGRPSDRTIIGLTNELQERIESGIYAEEKENWGSCLNISSTETCALEWAGGANKYICSYVLASDIEGQELSGEYAQGAVPIIEKSVAMAGYRLGGWLNMIVTGRDGLDEVAEGRYYSYEVVDGRKEELDDEDREINRQFEENERRFEGIMVQN